MYARMVRAVSKKAMRYLNTTRDEDENSSHKDSGGGKIPQTWDVDVGSAFYCCHMLGWPYGAGATIFGRSILVRVELLPMDWPPYIDIFWGSEPPLNVVFASISSNSTLPNDGLATRGKSVHPNRMSATRSSAGPKTCEIILMSYRRESSRTHGTNSLAA